VASGTGGMMGQFTDYIVFEYYPGVKTMGWRIQDRIFESDEYFKKE